MQPEPQTITRRDPQDFVTVTGDTAEILLDEALTSDQFLADLLGLISLRSFKEMIAAAGDVSNYVIRILSPGGSVFAGASIANEVRKLADRASVVVEIEMAASAATGIAIAAPKVRMAKNGYFMIHEARNSAWGTAGELESVAKLVRDANANIATAYVEKTGQTREQIEAWMAAETWFTAEEAKAAGFVDEIVGEMNALSGFDPRAHQGFDKLRNAVASLSASARTPAHKESGMNAANPAAEPVQQPTRTDFVAELGRYTDRFGAERGLELFKAQKPYNDALEAHAIAVEAERDKALVDLEAKAAELTAKDAEISTLKAEVESLKKKGGSQARVDWQSSDSNGGGDDSLAADDEDSDALAAKLWKSNAELRAEFTDEGAFRAYFAREPQEFTDLLN